MLDEVNLSYETTKIKKVRKFKAKKYKVGEIVTAYRTRRLFKKLETGKVVKLYNDGLIVDFGSANRAKIELINQNDVVKG